MKTTLDIPDGDIEAARVLTGAKSGPEAIKRAVRTFVRERQKRAALAARLRGSMPNLMSQAQLRAMREGRDWEKIK